MEFSYLKKILGLTQGHERTIKAKKNIYQSLIIRGLNMVVSFALVPLTINYLNPTKYGIWITLTSVITWFGFFDVGLGHGLRNKFAEAIANNDHVLARKYVSTTYAVLIIIIISFLLLFYLINPFLEWGVLLNVQEDLQLAGELKLLAVIVFTFFGLNFVFQLINTILTADQQPSKAALNDLVGKFLSLVLIWILVKTTNSSLINLGIVLSGSPVFILAIVSITFFNKNYIKYKPSVSFVDFTKAKDLLNLGVKFFIIRISAILLYSTNNIIIAHLFGPEKVTPYSIAMSYFNVLLLLFNIIVSPFWSAFTEAWVKKEIEWIKSTMKKLFYFWLALSVFGLVMLLISNFVYEIWIGDKVSIPFSLSMLVCIWILFISWNGVFSQFLYGVGAIKIQAYLVIIISLINVPLAIFLGNLWGIEGILLANILLAFVQMWVYPYQYKKIVTFNAKGIWVN